MSARAYCDHNAGAPLRPEAAAAMTRALSVGGNPSSVHAEGRAARRLMEDAREQVAASVGAQAENVVFVSGATEALHLALEAARGEARSLIYSAIEHDALAEHAPRVWPGAEIAPVTRAGVIDLEALGALLARAPRPALVAVMLANNETGVIQPIAQVAALVREHGGLLLVDAAQALGRIGVDIADLDATYLTVSSHKIGGPQGAGALVLAPGAPFRAARGGGGQERGRRPGTENVAAIAGFGAAAVVAWQAPAPPPPLEGKWQGAGQSHDRNAAPSPHPPQTEDATPPTPRPLSSREWERLALLRDRFESEAGLEIVAQDAPRLPNTSLFVLPHMRAETAVIAFDLAGVSVSAGAACSSGKVRKSRVLEAMGAPAAWQANAVRASFGWNSTAGDVDALLAALAKIKMREAAA